MGLPLLSRRVPCTRSVHSKINDTKLVEILRLAGCPSRVVREEQSPLRMTNLDPPSSEQSFAALDWTGEAPVPTLVADCGEGGFEHVEPLVHLRVGDDERHQQTNHIAVRTCSDGNQAVLVTILRYLPGFFVGWFTGLAGAHQFKRLHCAQTADITHEFPARLPLRGTAAEAVPELIGASTKVFGFDDLQHGERSLASCRIASEGSAQRTGTGRVHDRGTPGNGGERQTAAQRLGHRNEIGFEAEALAGKHRSGAREAGLHFIGDQEDSVLAADVREDGKELKRRSNESTLAHDWFHDHCGYGFSGDYTLESVFDVAGAVNFTRRILQRIGTAITVGEGDAVDVAGERLESRLIRMRFAGCGHRHVGAAMESVFECKNRGAPGVGAGDLDGILDGFGAGVDQKSLLGELAWRNRIEPFGQCDVALVGKYVEAGVKEAVELSTNGFDHTGSAMPCVEAADSTREIDEAVAVNVFDDSAFGFGDKHGRGVIGRAHDGSVTASHEILRAWARDWSTQLNS